MRREFNITGLCVPKKHYMINLNSRLEQMRKMIEKGNYFAVNRARQYGKTTTLTALAIYLRNEYTVIFLDFQSIGSEMYENENSFSRAFAGCFLEEFHTAYKDTPEPLKHAVKELEDAVKQQETFYLMQLFQYLMTICKHSVKPIVLMIDEVDTASNNQVFLDFLSQLRNYYLQRERKGTKTFHSVILAGVYDVKNLKRKLRPEEVHKMNSPWNIAADFDVDMSFDVDDIAGMLQAYESDVQTGMDIGKMAALLYEYTSGYPFLVSRLCMMMDEKLGKESGFASEKEVWTKEGFLAAVRMLLMEKNTLFESLLDKMEAYPSLKQMLRELLFAGKEISYNALDPSIALALMFGFVKKQNHAVVPANRIFDTLLYNFFLSQQETQGEEISLASQKDKNQFVLDEKTLIEAVV